MTDYFLLTGATGLLGRYLLRELTLAGLPLAVLARRTRWESASQRIETAMSHWEDELGHSLVRPVVLEGDIASPSLGLGASDLAWLEANAGSIIHSAASLTFYAEEAEGEPWRSNVQGTRNLIDVCRQAGIRRCHHVSTAYVCGKRRGRILESELDVGQEPGNDYERSKITSETEVLATDVFDQVTVYRPSIIVGDSRTGFTTSYHGFYTPLRLFYGLLQTVPWETLLAGDWLGNFELEGDERKNLVPVDWVAAAMTRLITNPALHGTTYHLTNPRPSTVATMCESFAEELTGYALSQPPPRVALDISEFLETFREQMKIYESYWSDDPEFDSARTETALADLPCPVVDLPVMQRLVQFAIEKNFGWPREAPAVAPFDVASALRDWLAAEQSAVTEDGTESLGTVSLRVSGRGGGQYHLVTNQGHLVGAGRGLLNGGGAICHLTSTTFAELTRGELSLEDSIRRGRLVVTGKTLPRASELAKLFRELAVSATGEKP